MKKYSEYIKGLIIGLIIGLVIPLLIFIPIVTIFTNRGCTSVNVCSQSFGCDKATCKNGIATCKYCESDDLECSNPKETRCPFLECLEN